MDDREEKVQKTIKLTTKQNITSISGQPSWISNFLYRLLEEKSQNNIHEIRPNLELFFR
jgi:hypothetical protein